MAIHPKIQIYKMSGNLVLAKDFDDAITFAKKCRFDKPEQVSKDIYLSEILVDYLCTFNAEEVKEGGILAGWGLYRIISDKLNMFQEPVPPTFANARDPADALSTIVNQRESWDNSTYTVENLTPRAQYTGNALQTLVRDILASKNK